jgi:hypothetical protein
MYAITCMQETLSSMCSLIIFCGIMNSCGEIIMYVVYVVILGGSLSPQHGASSGCRYGTASSYGGGCNTLNKQMQTNKG